MRNQYWRGIVLCNRWKQANERLKGELMQYHPWNDQEEKDREELMKWLSGDRNVWTRENTAAHLTASAWVTSTDRNQILMAYHRIYQSWSWLGGHADGDADLLQVALKEVREESGVHSVRPLSERIFSLEILCVEGHEKRGIYVPSHLHLNVTYLLEADPKDELCIREDENSAVQWFSLSEAVNASSEPWFRKRIYSKLNAKMKFERI